jgi:spore germination protein KA
MEGFNLEIWKKIRKNIFTFKEPQVEPEFVLAWDNPEEISKEAKKIASQTTENFESEVSILPPGIKLTGKIDQDTSFILEAFGGSKSKSLGRRELTVAGSTIAIFFIEHLVDPLSLANHILIPLSKLTKFSFENITTAIAGFSVKITDNLESSLEQLRQGKSLILISGEQKIILAETGAAPHRRVSEAINERTIIGPQEAFTEDLATNLALIQKRYRNHQLQIETFEVGTNSHTPCAILSVKGLTNPRLLAEVKRRVSKVTLSHLTDSGMLAQLIEDNLWQLYPQIRLTERPDQIAAILDEGRVAVVVEGSHQVLMMPITAIEQLHSPEDYSVRWPYGLYLRLIRILATFMIIFLPAFYIAVNLYQPELIPTDVLLSLVAIKLHDPLPTIIEVVLVTLILEILREAGFRGPKGMAGPLIIIIGLTLGMLAVFTNIINPVLLIVIAFTGIASFLMPEYSASLGFRLTSYIYMLLAFIYGYIGIAFGAFLHLHLIAKQKSFGVPMLAPIAPITSRDGDVVLMRSTLGRKPRPDYLDALKRKKQPQNTQGWKEEPKQINKSPKGEKE